MAYLTLAGNYGLKPYFVDRLEAGSVIDARTASWNLSHSDVPDPFRVYSAPNVTITGGSIKGDVSLTGDWRSVYDVNYSAAVKVRWSPNAVIEDWRIDQVWDAITVRDGTTNWLVDDVHLTNIRDDGLDNDHMASGTLRDSLFDGVFVGISTDSTDAVNGGSNVVTLENTFIRMQKYSYEGKFTHGAPLKTDADYPDHQPSLRFINSVIAISDVNHAGWGRTKLAWENTVEVQNSYYLNLSDTPFPSNYPLPPGFTILQGQEARNFWEASKAAWLDNHDGTPYADVTPLPGQTGTPLPPPPSAPQPAPEPTPEPAPTDTVSPQPAAAAETQTVTQPEPAAPAAATPPATILPPATAAEPAPATLSTAPAATRTPISPTFSDSHHAGTRRSETIVGNDLDNVIEGKKGADTIWGGAGDDIFVTRHGKDTKAGGRRDLYMDFGDGADKFDFSAIDANVKLKGNQEFTFIGSSSFSAPGQVRAVYDGSDRTHIYFNTDKDLSAEYQIEVIGQHAFTTADFIL